MKKDKLIEIRESLINSEELVEEVIYSLNEKEQNEIFNMDNTPSNKELLFLDETYTSLNELINKVNHLTLF